MRPLGPVPGDRARSMPRSRASRRTSGLTKRRRAVRCRRRRTRLPDRRRLGDSARARRRLRGAASRRPRLGVDRPAYSGGAGGRAARRSTISPGSAEHGDRARRPRRRPGLDEEPGDGPVGLGLVLDDGLLGLDLGDRLRRPRPRRRPRRARSGSRPRSRRPAPPASARRSPSAASPRRRAPARGRRRPPRCARSPRARAPSRCSGSPRRRSRARPAGRASRSSRRWISSASQPPYDVPRAPCSTMSTALVFLRMLSPIVSQSSDARSSQRRSMTSASMPGLLDRLEAVAHHREVADDRRRRRPRGGRPPCPAG